MKDLISSGNMQDAGGNNYNFNILKGVELSKMFSVQQNWTSEFVIRYQNLKADNPNTSDTDLINQFNLQDHHWNWVSKAIHLDNSDYLWFSLEVGNNVEAIIVVFHPQQSRIIQSDIYYIDYLAVAPWNRDIGKSPRKFKALGPLLIKEAGKYIGTNLTYGYSFSLHSLPQASGFYNRIGMIDFGADIAKQNLHYFEMEEKEAEDFVYDR